MLRAAILLALMLAAPLAAQAEGCDEAADQAAINECAAKGQADAQAELDRLYVDLDARLMGEQEKLDLMNAAREAGTAFREAECAFASSGVEGGSMHPAIHATCMADMLKARAEQLKSYLDCPEGDLSCPVPWLQ
jgi:uncharacterized protein YecT (DUF1311 family)